MQENKKEKLIELFVSLIKEHKRCAEMLFSVVVLLILSVVIEAIGFASVTTSIILCGGGCFVALAIMFGALNDGM